MESEFDDELRQLKNALRQETFRFILVGHNRFSIYQDISSWLRTTFPDRHFLELRLANKDYRQINDELMTLQKGIVLIPDFGWLFRKENEAICVAFNQRRDAFARLDIALICFIEPSQFIEVPKKVPDWWSLRSLELDFHRQEMDVSGEFLDTESEVSSLGGQTKEEKEAEILRLQRQVDDVDPSNKPLLFSLYSQLSTLLFELSSYEEALHYLERSLTICQQVGNKRSEGAVLNNISQIHKARGDYETALRYLEQSLTISQQIGDKRGEGTILNNISQIYQAREDYEAALSYLEQSLDIRHQTGDKNGEGITLNNIGQIYDIRGDYQTALSYLEQSLTISQQIGDKRGEGISLNNISLIHKAQGNYEIALRYLEQSLSIRQQIGDKRGEGITLNNIGVIYWVQYKNVEKAIPLLIQAYTILTQIGSPDAEVPVDYLNDIHEEIGEEKFNQIVQTISNE